MRPSCVWLVAASCALLGGCADRNPASREWREPPVPSVIVSVDSHTVQLETVRAMLAPPVAFDARVRPDPAHASPVIARASGSLLQLRGAGPVRVGDRLALFGPSPGTSTGTETLDARTDGLWVPRRVATQPVASGDTIGFLDDGAYWMAVGSIHDADAGAVHPGDPAVLTFGDAHSSTRPGRVEWVRPSANYTTEVAIEFRDRAGCLTCVPPVSVVVTPAETRDSVPAVSEAAVVTLDAGPGVFVPIGPHRWEVRWIATGQSVDGMVVIRSGLSPGTKVVVRGLGPLIAAARDSLRRLSGVPAK